VLLLAGVNQVFVRPFRDSSPVPAAIGVDGAAAGQVAARFVADYLTYQPSAGDDAAVAGPPTSPAGWSGSDRLSSDLVEPGAVARLDAAHVFVSVEARIRSATAGVTPALTSKSSSASPRPDQTTVRWVTLTVPVEATDRGLTVSDGGPIFTGEAPTSVSAMPDGQPDSTTTFATQSLATTFFTGYARSDVSYLTIPGARLAGLSNEVQLLSLTGWSVITPPSKPGTSPPMPTTGLGSGIAVWQLAGTDLRIAQRYLLALSKSQGRWYAAALGPDPTIRES
jgi:hypothetical protein